jgi:hypothetical protein
MALPQADLQQIGEYVKGHIAEWIAEQSLGKPPVVYEIELRERMVRVEEELKHQRELMREDFEQVDKRFNEMLERHDKHFLWLVGLIATGVGLVITAIRYLPASTGP